jgi:ABC-type thiamin/hydroxymethylpyrimidine transport system permease subunit
MEPNTETRRPRLDIRDLVLIALLAAVGGVLSTYIGYLGNLVNRLFGVPFGAGQLIAGLHVLWPLLARLLIGRFGSGTLTGLLKGVVEFFSGGTHGIVIVVVSLIEGLLVDSGLGVLRRRSLPLAMLTGAVASASNVFVFQSIYFSGVSMSFILVMAGLSFVSGALLGGYLAWDVERLLVSSRIVRRELPEPRHGGRWWRHAVTLVVALGLLGGGAHFYLNVFEPFADAATARIEGNVEASFLFRFADWEDDVASVRAELRGSATYVPARDYSGVPLILLLDRASPLPGASGVRVMASDGYEAAFELADIDGRGDILLALEDEGLRLIAPGYDGAYWVRRVTRIVVQ